MGMVVPCSCMNNSSQLVTGKFDSLVKSLVVWCDLFLCSPPTGYIGEFEIIDDHRAGKIVVNLTGRLNKVKPSSPLCVFF